MGIIQIRTPTNWPLRWYFGSVKTPFLSVLCYISYVKNIPT